MLEVAQVFNLCLSPPPHSELAANPGAPKTPERQRGDWARQSRIQITIARRVRHAGYTEEHSLTFTFEEPSVVATVHPRYLVDHQQMPTDVVVPIEEWRRIVEELEELEDLRAYDAAVAEKQATVPLDTRMSEVRARRGS